MNLPLHPVTGVHYAQAIPGMWGPHADLHAIYTRFAGRCPWISVHDPQGVTESVWQDPQTVVFAWDSRIPVPGSRQAKVALVYSEAIGGELLPAHAQELRRVQAGVPARYWDAVCAHTPWMVEQLRALVGLPTYLLPVGYDEPTMGAPRFGSEKGDECVWYGSPVGKRALVMPYLESRLGSRLRNVSGAFGRLLLATLERSHASLYVAHSDCQSYSTWRLWQTLATSACLITEPGDCWPLDPTRHAVLLPRITWTNANTVADEIGRVLREVDLLAIARVAHDEIARAYTVERMINEYMVPAGAQIRGT